MARSTSSLLSAITASELRAGANFFEVRKRPKEVAHVAAYIGTGESGWMGGPKVMNLIIELQISC